MARSNCKHMWRSSIRGAVCRHCGIERGDATNLDGHNPRNDNVLLRVVSGLKVNSLDMPDIAVEGKQTVVVAIGPDVRDLKVGDIVLCTGNLETETYLLPRCNDAVVAAQKNVRLVIGHVEEDNKLEIAGE